MSKPAAAGTKVEQICEWVGIAAVLASAFAWVALLSHDPGDWGGMSWPANVEILNKGSKVGAMMSWFLFLHFGVASFLIAGVLGLWGGVMFLRKKTSDPFFKFFGAAVVVLSTSILASLAVPAIDASSRWHNTMTSLGGLYGEAGARLLRSNLGTAGAVMAVLFALCTSALIATDWLLLTALLRGRKALEDSYDATWGRISWKAVSVFVKGMFAGATKKVAGPATAAVAAAGPGKITSVPKIPAPKVEPKQPEPLEDEEAKMVERVEAPKPVAIVPKPVAVVAPPAPKAEKPKIVHKANAQLPPLTLLEDVEIEPTEIDHEGRMVALQNALQAFEVEAKVLAYEAGPVVTCYEIELSPGTRVSKILGLAPDLGIQLAVPTIRIVYPLPNKTTIGIEVPNPRATSVRLRNLINQTEDAWRRMHLPQFFGEGATGKPIVCDLQEMPHLLIAGTTGSGKSVCLTTMILSLLLSRTSDDLKMILIDPKMVELSAFKEIPHLMAPVVTDMKRAPIVLDWVVRQMEERYSLFASVGVKKIEQFNALGEKKIMEKVAEEGEEAPDVPTHLPYIVVVIDELADLMMVSAKEVEAAITRISQKSRAVGIHMVLATQRPSVDVITGLIKSNMPSRIAFKVAAMVDSRTILDQPGAEKLLGKGDMLLSMNGSMQLMRGQCTWVTDEEAKDVINWLQEKGGSPVFDAELTQVVEAPSTGGDGGEGSCDDELFEKAAEVIIGEQRGSVSLLQRKLEIGFSRAGKLMDVLEKRGIVGPQIGAKAREVRMTLAAWQARHVPEAEQATA